MTIMFKQTILSNILCLTILEFDVAKICYKT